MLNLITLAVLVVGIIIMRGTIMSAKDNLIAAVHRQTTVTQSAVTAINSIAERLAAAIAANDDEELQALSEELTNDGNALAAAIAANTVASGEAHPETGEPVGNDPAPPAVDPSNGAPLPPTDTED